MECKVRDMVVHYGEAGSGTPLLVLHGWGLDHRYVQHDMESHFADRDGWRRIYVDLPGMGKTRAPDWLTNQDQVLDVLLEFIDAVAPGERFAAAGTSYGGYLIRGLVYRRGAQMDGALFIVPGIEQDRSKKNLPQHRVIREDAAFLAALAPEEQWLRDLVVAQSVELLETHRRLISPAAALADQHFLARLAANEAFSFDLDAMTEPFPAPALFLTGRFDPWVGYREAYNILDQYPRATFAVLDGAGHGLPVEQRGLFRALVGEWLDRVEAYRVKR